MKVPLLVLAIVLSSTLRAGDPVCDFREANPGLSKSYWRLAITSPESEIDHVNDAFDQVVSAILHTVGVESLENLRDPRAKALVQRHRELAKAQVDAWRSIRGEMIAGDVLVYFEWKEGRRAKAGHLLLNGGKIRKEWIIAEGEDFLSPDDGDANKRREGTPGRSLQIKPSQVSGVPHP